MNRWHELAARRRCELASAEIAEIAETLPERHFGNSGTIGAGKNVTKTDCSARPFQSNIVEPADIMRTDGKQSANAERIAPQELNCASWLAIAEERREQISAILERLPAPCRNDGERLFEQTQEFIKSPWFSQTIALGWTLSDLFGVYRYAPTRVGEWGLVTSLAWSAHRGARLDAITDDRAIIRYPSGSMLTYYRFMPAKVAAVPWWECSALFGSSDALRD